MVVSLTLFTAKVSGLAGKLARVIMSHESQRDSNQYTLYVPQVQPTRHIDSNARLAGALVHEIHCVTATIFLTVLNPLRLLRSLFFFFPLCLPSSVAV